MIKLTLFLTTLFCAPSLLSMEYINEDCGTHIITLCDTQSKIALHGTSKHFHHLCSYCNLEAILDHNHNALNDKQKEYALLWATQRNEYGIVKRLFERGTNPNADNPIHLSPLTVARQKNDFPMIKLLKDHGCTAAIKKAPLPLFIIATYTKDIETLQQCIDLGEYDPVYKCRNKTQILHLAAIIGDANILTMLLTQPSICAKINNHNALGQTPCWIAAYKGYTVFIETIIAHPHTNINKTDHSLFSPTYCAIKNGHKEVVELLTNHQRYNVNEQRFHGCTQLYKAAESNDIDVAKRLITDHAINVNVLFKQRYTALFVAAESGYTRMVKLLLTCDGIQTDLTVRATPLYIATCNGHLDCVKILCLANPNTINTPFNLVNTPIWAALYNNRIEIAKHLLSYEITDTSIAGDNGYTPLSIACSSNNYEIAALLLKHSPHTVNICNNTDGNYPLHIAATKGYTAIVAILLQTAGVKVNCVNKNNSTPLDLTAQNDLIIAHLLMNKGGMHMEDIMRNNQKMSENVQKNPNSKRARKKKKI